MELLMQLPKGFRFAGVSAGIKSRAGAKDVTLRIGHSVYGRRCLHHQLDRSGPSGFVSLPNTFCEYSRDRRQ